MNHHEIELSDQLFKAIDDNDIHLVRYLIEQGAPLERIIDSGERAEEQFTPLLVAVNGQFGSTCDIQIIEYLLQKGASVNARDCWGFTPLHQAAYNHGQADVIRLLLKYDADVNAKSHDGSTPIMYAVGYDHNSHCFESTKFLLENGADLELMNNNGVSMANMFEENNDIEFACYRDLIGSYLEQKKLDSVTSSSEAMTDGLGF